MSSTQYEELAKKRMEAVQSGNIKLAGMIDSYMWNLVEKK